LSTARNRSGPDECSADLAKAEPFPKKSFVKHARAKRSKQSGIFGGAGHGKGGFGRRRCALKKPSSWTQLLSTALDRFKAPREVLVAGVV